MKFAHPLWLSGSALALVVAIILVFGGFRLIAALRRFGDDERMGELLTSRAGARRALRGALSVVAVAACFVALAKPQYGRGTRLIPATNLDVVVVLDYSKSMYARDIAPSRSERAKVEVGRLIAQLPGARFGAVAFAGDPVSFPLTSDGSAISQFFRQLTPRDMPVGGTAIARALEAGRDLLRRDPLSIKHRRVIVLVTDGEDLEGDPVAVARAAREEHTTIHVVQIGGRTPEPIPDVDEAGNVAGLRRDARGNVLTTALSAEGERQLAEVAKESSGLVVRSDAGGTGIKEITSTLEKLMSEELSERVETIYADVYAYPLGFGVLLLVIEAFIGDAPRRRPRPTEPKPRKRPRSRLRRHTMIAATGALWLAACKDLPNPFMRYAPEVDRALGAYDAGDANAAARNLSEYLSTGACKDGEIGVPDPVRALPQAAFDLGLSLFEIGERFGERFGAQGAAHAPGQPPNEALTERRHAQINCALRAVRVIAQSQKTPLRLRAKAQYLTGNLEFLRADYRSAVVAYDATLKLVPGGEGMPDVGNDAAWNRGIALRRAKEQERPPDAGAPDAGRPDGGKSDGGPPGDGGKAESDSGKQEPPRPDGAPPEHGDAGAPTPNEPEDEGKQAENPPPAKPPEQEQKQEQPAPAQPSLSQDERILDMLEQAPTLQQEAARRNRGRVLRGMDDK